MCFIAFNVCKKISDIPRLSVGFGSMNQVPSRLRITSRSVKWGQIGPNGAKQVKWLQLGPKRIKRGKARPSVAKYSQTEPNKAKWGQIGPNSQIDQTEPNWVKWSQTGQEGTKLCPKGPNIVNGVKQG